MAALERWIFSKELLKNTPSIRAGMTSEVELNQRQQAAQFIQDMGQRLSVNQLCINTAIVYMHRFYMYQAFTDGAKTERRFHRQAIAAAALFLAAKVEEQPRKLEHVVRVAHVLSNRERPQLDPKSDQYMEKAQELVTNENVILQTLGFDVQIEHPHKSVVNCCNLVKASKDLAQSSYFMATNSLHLTTFCLQYKPTVVACVCIHLACMWSNWEIPKSSEGKDWFYYVDRSVTKELLEELTKEFLNILQKTPLRLKKRLMSFRSAQGGNNKEEMARRASLEFASATNNTHLAPTIHHRGLDHPGEGAAQPTPEGGASETSATAASSAKPNSTPGVDSAKAAPVQTPPPGAVAGTSGTNKKTPNNSRPTGSAAHSQHPHQHAGAGSRPPNDTTPQRGSHKRPSEGQGGRGASGAEGEPTVKKIKPEVPPNSRITPDRHNPTPHSQSFPGDPSKRSSTESSAHSSHQKPVASHAGPAHPSSQGGHRASLGGQTSSAGHASRHSNGGTALQQHHQHPSQPQATKNPHGTHPHSQQPHQQHPQQQHQQRMSTPPKAEGDQASGKTITTPPCVVSLGTKVEKTLADTDTLLSRGTLQLIQSPEFHHNKRQFTKHIDPIVARQRTLSGSEGAPPVKSELLLDSEVIDAADGNCREIKSEAKHVKAEKTEIKSEHALIDGTLPSKSSSVPLPTTSPGSHIHPDSNNASAAATSVKTETKTHKSEKTHKSDRSEKHHKHHKHRDKEKSHKRDKDKHREGREASDSPKLKIKPVVQSDAPNDNLADSFATASPTSGLKLKLRIGGPGGGSGNGGSLTPVKGGTLGAKEAGINALVAKHEVLDGSHGFPKKEHATGNGNHVTGSMKQESFLMKEESGDVNNDMKKLPAPVVDIKLKSEHHPASSKGHHVHGSGARLYNGGSSDVAYSNGSLKRKSLPAHPHAPPSGHHASSNAHAHVVEGAVSSHHLTGTSSSSQRGPPPYPHGRVSLPGYSEPLDQVAVAVAAATGESTAPPAMSLNNWVQGQYPGKGHHHELPASGHRGTTLHNYPYSHPPG